jgi:hypothetical protein
MLEQLLAEHSGSLLPSTGSGVCQRPIMRAMFFIYLTVVVVGLAGFTLVGLLER